MESEEDFEETLALWSEYLWPADLEILVRSRQVEEMSSGGGT